jgi:hypothetical protein
MVGDEEMNVMHDLDLHDGRRSLKSGNYPNNEENSLRSNLRSLSLSL